MYSDPAAARTEAESRAAERTAAAQVDADRKVTQAHALVARICGQLLRRDVATDLVPDWIRGEIATAVEVVSTWPEGIADTARIRELETLLLLSQQRENEVYGRLRSAEDALATWHRRAVQAEEGREPTMPVGEVVASAHEGRRFAENLLREERRGRIEATNRAETLADFVATLPKLPVPVAKLHPDHVEALAIALDPMRRRSAAPNEVIAELTGRALQLWRQGRAAHARAGAVERFTREERSQ